MDTFRYFLYFQTTTDTIKHVKYFQKYLQNIGSDDLEELEVKGTYLNMNPLQVAAHFESPEALSALFKHLDKMWQENKFNNDVTQCILGLRP